MANVLQAESGRDRGRGQMVAEINVVPFIDIVLVLLIIFMMAAPGFVQGLRVNLPDAVAEPISSEDSEPLIVSVASDGRYHVNVGTSGESDAYLSIDRAVDKVAKVLNFSPNKVVMVWGDEKVSYGKVIELMARLETIGAVDIGLVTENPPINWQ